MKKATLVERPPDSPEPPLTPQSSPKDTGPESLEQPGPPMPDVEVLTGPDEVEQDKQSAEEQAEQAHSRDVGRKLAARMWLLTGNLVVARWEGAEPVSEAEAEQLGEATMDLVDYYELSFLEPPWSLWLAFGGATVVVFGPRYMQAQEHARQRAEQQRRPPPSSPVEPPPASPPPAVDPEAASLPDRPD